jgi:release factor glutamine methyltransferase
MKINAHIKSVAQKLLPVCGDIILATQEAWWITEAVTGRSKYELLSVQKELSSGELHNLSIFIDQRVQEKKPLQYILGIVPFCGLKVNVRKPILIPRPETEEWVSWLIDEYKAAGVAKFTALDLCTGSGCIGLALAKHFQQSIIVGTDINNDAITLARENCCNANLSNASFITSDLYAHLPSTFKFHLIVSNPPYLSIDEYCQLGDDVRKWEDSKAFLGGDDGMFFYQKILLDATQFLCPLESHDKELPNVVFEVGPAQNESLEKLLASFGIHKYTIHKDMQNKYRWVSIKVPI